MGQIKCILGKLRDMIREAHTRSIAAGIAGSRLVILEGDHFVASNEPGGVQPGGGGLFGGSARR